MHIYFLSAMWRQIPPDASAWEGALGTQFADSDLFFPIGFSFAHLAHTTLGQGWKGRKDIFQKAWFEYEWSKGVLDRADCRCRV